MFCPILKDECKKDQCSWWIKLMVRNPQTEELKENSACAIPLLVDVSIDSAKGINRVQSAVESNRNVNNVAQNILLKALGMNNSRKVIGG